MQIPHSEGSHWITVSNIGMPEGEVMVLDSRMITAEQVCALVHTSA